MTLGARVVRRVMIAAILTSATTRALAAQVVTGTVTDSATSQPISGAVMTLLDSARNVLAQDITNERGQYSVAYGGRVRSLRVTRIGFQPRELPFTAAENPGRVLDVTMTPFKTTLAAVRITEQANCPTTSDRAAALAYWDQARAGLLNTVVARKTHPMAVHRLYFQRALSAKNDSITSFVVFEDSSRTAETSFSTVRTARDLVRLGFSPDTNLVGYMFGPDADVLLDDAFATGYCFRIAPASKTRPNQVGLAFGPSDFKSGRVDIAGTLWVDTTARTLHDVEFRYIGMREIVRQFQPGGTISFATSENGVTFINRWSLRLFGNAPDTTFVPGTCRGGCFRTRDNLYPTENGAEVSHAVWRDGRRWDAPLGAVSVSAVTGAGQPSAGTLVQLGGTQYHGTTDSSGTVLIRDLLPGPYALRVHDKRVESLGFLLPTAVTFAAARDSVVRLTLTVPTVEDYAASQCRKARQWRSTDSTYIVGRVLDPDKRPVAGVLVSYALQMQKPGQKAEWSWGKESFTTGDDGMFQFCGATFTQGQPLLLRVSRSGSRDTDVTHKTTGNMTIVRIRVDAQP
jgi:hypothetical protein